MTYLTRKTRFLMIAVISLILSCFVVSADSSRIEGEGYDTPEEAITAFAEALRDGDLEKMVSTFAIESYCEHYDLAAQIQRLSAIQPILLTGNYPLMGTNSLAEGLSIEARRSDIVNRIRTPLLSIALDYAGSDSNDYEEISSDLISGKAVYGDTLREMNYAELAEMLTALEAIPDFSDMEISGPYSPLVLSTMAENYISESNINNMFRNALLINAEGYTEQAIILHNETDAYFVILNTVKYNDKWYNNSTNTTLMMMLGMDNNRLGIIGGPKSLFSSDVGDDFDGFLELWAVSEKIYLDENLSNIRLKGAEINAAHKKMIKRIEEEAKSYGLQINTSLPLLPQKDKLIELAELEGDKPFFSGSDFNSIGLLTFDELLDFFSMDVLKEALK